MTTKYSLIKQSPDAGDCTIGVSFDNIFTYVKPLKPTVCKTIILVYH